MLAAASTSPLGLLATQCQVRGGMVEGVHAGSVVVIRPVVLMVCPAFGRTFQVELAVPVTRTVLPTASVAVSGSVTVMPVPVTARLLLAVAVVLLVTDTGPAGVAGAGPCATGGVGAG